MPGIIPYRDEPKFLCLLVIAEAQEEMHKGPAPVLTVFRQIKVAFLSGQHNISQIPFGPQDGIGKKKDYRQMQARFCPFLYVR